MSKRILMCLILVAYATLMGTSSHVCATDHLGEMHHQEEPEIVSRYKSTLPPVMLPGEENKVQSILDYIQTVGGGKLCPDAEIATHSQIDGYIKSGQPIEICILGFPCKSGNTDLKVMSSAFDLADYLGLVTLQHLATGIGKIYKHGAKITIINREPYIEELQEILEDELGLEDCYQMNGYRAVLARLIASFPCLSLGGDYTADYKAALQKSRETVLVKGDKKQVDFFKRELECKLIEDYVIHRDEAIVRARLHAELSQRPYKNKKWEALQPNELEKRIQESVEKNIAQKMRENFNLVRKCLAEKMAATYELGVTVFREIVSEKHPHHIRMSIHGHKDRIHMNMIHGQTCVPWHMLLATDGKGFLLESKDDLAKKAPYKQRKKEMKSVRIDGCELSYIILGD
jgi:hypothetical protein